MMRRRWRVGRDGWPTCLPGWWHGISSAGGRNSVCAMRRGRTNQAKGLAMDVPVFDSTRSAIVFAFNFSTAQYGEGVLGRLASRHAASGKGLVGMDGAGCWRLSGD